MYHRQDLFDDIELLDGAGDDFDLEAVRRGELTPVFFGSALTNFGVEPFLEQFLKITTSPLARETVDGIVEPMSDYFSAFVFKIQANMNKAHRDRVAFMRICSGKFEKIWRFTTFRATKNASFSATTDYGAGKRNCRRGVRRRYYRCV